MVDKKEEDSNTDECVRQVNVTTLHGESVTLISSNGKEDMDYLTSLAKQMLHNISSSINGTSPLEVE